MRKIDMAVIRDRIKDIRELRQWQGLKTHGCIVINPEIAQASYLMLVLLKMAKKWIVVAISAT